jgi:hypothetical protein
MKSCPGIRPRASAISLLPGQKVRPSLTYVTALFQKVRLLIDLLVLVPLIDVDAQIGNVRAVVGLFQNPILERGSETMHVISIAIARLQRVAQCIGVGYSSSSSVSSSFGSCSIHSPSGVRRPGLISRSTSALRLASRRGFHPGRFPQAVPHIRSSIRQGFWGYSRGFLFNVSFHGWQAITRYQELLFR